MPLVVPGLQSSTGDKTSDWMNKLAGKKLGDNHDANTFAKTDLPRGHRVLQGKDAAMTLDYNPDRLNVHTTDDGTVTKVTHG